MAKVMSGNFFEDFEIGQRLRHATPRTVTDGDVALYQALYGSRFAVTSGATFAAACGQDRMPLDSLLVFHVVFGKTVPDVSINAVANLGYAGGVFGVPVYPGDTLTATSEVIGLKENSNGKTGVVYVHSVGVNQRDEVVLDYNRWVMVNKRDQSAAGARPGRPEPAHLGERRPAAGALEPRRARLRHRARGLAVPLGRLRGRREDRPRRRQRPSRRRTT